MKLFLFQYPNVLGHIMFSINAISTEAEKLLPQIIGSNNERREQVFKIIKVISKVVYLYSLHFGSVYLLFENV